MSIFHRYQLTRAATSLFEIAARQPNRSENPTTALLDAEAAADISDVLREATSDDATPMISRRKHR